MSLISAGSISLDSTFKSLQIPSLNLITNVFIYSYTRLKHKVFDTHRAQINSAVFQEDFYRFLETNVCCMQNPVIDYSPRKREIDHMDAMFLYKTDLYTETSQAAKKGYCTKNDRHLSSAIFSMIS